MGSQHSQCEKYCIKILIILRPTAFYWLTATVLERFANVAPLSYYKNIMEKQLNGRNIVNLFSTYFSSVYKKSNFFSTDPFPVFEYFDAINNCVIHFMDVYHELDI